MLNIGKTLALWLLVVAIPANPLQAQGRQDSRATAPTVSWDIRDRRMPVDKEFDGKPLSYWIKAIRDRNEATMSLALDAIRILGPEAKAAVPELTRLLSDPFHPIQLVKDSDETIAAKLYDIEVRSSAIDALASIGKAAAPATLPVIQWALTVRVIPTHLASSDEQERFVALVMLEAEYRIHVIGAIEQFGEPAKPALVRLLRSPDAERRKLAAIALGTDILPIATDFLTSRDCDDAQLGITLLKDLAPAVAPNYLAELQDMLTCDAN